MSQPWCTKSPNDNDDGHNQMPYANADAMLMHRYNAYDTTASSGYIHRVMLQAIAASGRACKRS